MSARLEAVRERMERRDEMAQRIQLACVKQSVKVRSDAPTVSNVFIVEDTSGTQYTVTVARKQQQSQ